MSLDAFGKNIASRRHDGQPAPEVVEHTGAERKPRLRVVEMGADAYVGFKKKILPLPVVHPTEVEVDETID